MQLFNCLIQLVATQDRVLLSSTTMTVSELCCLGQQPIEVSTSPVVLCHCVVSMNAGEKLQLGVCQVWDRLCQK